MAGPKQPKDMNLDELIDAIISVNIAHQQKLKAVDEQSAPYGHKEKLKQDLQEEYQKEINPYIDELNRKGKESREKAIYKKEKQDDSDK